MKIKQFASVIKCGLLAAALYSSSSFAAHDPVLMIPGMGGTASNMQTMKTNLQNNGWPANILFTWTDADQMNKDMEVSARAISAKVDEILRQTGAKKVVLTTWSASTIAGRYYLKNLGGTAKVSQFISFAGPHHGISIWRQCQQTATACRNQWGPNDPVTPWLAALNADTEVPGSPAVKYLTIRSTADNNATPYDTAKLAGAHENYLMSGPMAPNHFTIITDSTALAKMRSFITANEDPSTTPDPTDPPPTPTPTGPCYTANNYSHVTAGRAYQANGGYALAKGSNQNMGLNNLYVTSKLRMTASDYYVIDNTCQ